MVFIKFINIPLRHWPLPDKPIHSKSDQRTSPNQTEADEACPPLRVPESSSPPSSNTPQLSIDLPCETKVSEQTDSSDLSARSRVTVKDTNLSARSKLSEYPQATSRSKVPTTDHALTRFSSASKHSNMGAGDVASQTRREIGTNSDNPHSFAKMQPGKEGRQEVLEQCDNRTPPAPTPRNPITGLGLGEDGVGGIKPKKPKDRRGLRDWENNFWKFVAGKFVFLEI